MAENHGNTPAAWTAVLIALAGFVVGAVGIMVEPVNMVIFWIGVVITLAAGVIFAVMAKMGLHETGH